ncbi:MAG TPA: hypothetical protein VGJ84_14255 [Polyangiaceae bacterium]|jgi:predicted transcriptional regulator
MIEHVLSVRVDQEMLVRLNRIAEAMSKRAAGVEVKRATVTRASLDRGVAVLEAELGLAKKTKPKR